MTTALDELIAIVTPEPLGDDRFRGVGSRNDGVDATFGGHFLGQAVAAAHATVDGDQRIHSLHGYFLRAGRPDTPFDIEVERLRDGFRFCHRRVRIGQEGTTQFELTASFTLDAEGPELRPTPPPDLDRLPSPESLPGYRALMSSLDELPLPEAWARRDPGIDIRTISAPWAPGGPSAQGGIRLWIRAVDAIPDDPGLHSALLAYQSDESLADTVAIPWGGTWGTPGVVFVSLDHAIWFHRPFDLNRWHLLDQRPVTVSGQRGLATAEVWSTDGELVASVNQEALLRLSPDLVEGHHG
ncbi:MAG: acyl-CoA thioesterase domain-containing protein [Actinomycetota bacterium]